MAGKTVDSKAYNESLNLFAKLLKDASVGIPVRTWIPLRRWPAAPHPAQAAMNAYRAYPSEYNKPLDK